MPVILGSTIRPPTSTMKGVIITVIVVLATATALPPVKKGKTFYFDGLTKGFTISRVTEDTQAQPANNYQVRFVPLISLIASMFPSLMARLGQFAGVNKQTTTTNNRRLDLAEKPGGNAQNVTSQLAASGEESEEDDGDEDYQEKELIECDGHHLGLWPDKTDAQRYYKCEVDPRTTPTTACIRELISQESSKSMQPMEKIEVPGVKPCYLLSMLKCANGFKYQHSTRICVPDIVYVHRH